MLVLELADRGNGNASEELIAKNTILEALIRANIPIRGFEASGGRLHDVFLQLTTETIG